LLIAGILLLIILSVLGLLGFARDAVGLFSYPVQTSYQMFSRAINRIFDREGDEDDLKLRIQELEAQLKDAATDYVELTALREENELLKKQLDYTEEQNYSDVTAKVLTYINSPNEKYLIVNRGARHGVQSGQPVMSGDGLLIGRTTEVENRIAKIALITDPRSKVPVKILGEDKTIGIASGSYGAILKMELIPTQEGIAVNDIVVTSNLEEHIPSNLIVGMINEINIHGNEPFKTALVEPMADFYDIQIVSIITGYDD